MLAVAGCMRSAVIHPVLPSGGRDITVFFSPSRRNKRAVLKRQERKNYCVCCGRTTVMRENKEDDDKKRTDRDALENLGDSDVNAENDPVFVVDTKYQEYFDDSDDVKEWKRQFAIPIGVSRMVVLIMSAWGKRRLSVRSPPNHIIESQGGW